MDTSTGGDRCDMLELQARVLRIWERKWVVLEQNCVRFYRPGVEHKLLFSLSCDKILVRISSNLPPDRPADRHSPTKIGTLRGACRQAFISGAWYCVPLMPYPYPIFLHHTVVGLKLNEFLYV